MFLFSVVGGCCIFTVFPVCFRHVVSVRRRERVSAVMSEVAERWFTSPVGGNRSLYSSLLDSSREFTSLRCIWLNEIETDAESNIDLWLDLVLATVIKPWVSLCPGRTVRITVPFRLCVSAQTSACLSPAPCVWTPSSPSCPTLFLNVLPAMPAGSTETVFRCCEESDVYDLWT